LKRSFTLILALSLSVLCDAADYEIELGRVVDFEELRSLIDFCSDLGELEPHRSLLESASDLEDLREFLEVMDTTLVTDCPADIEVDGATLQNE
jgi:hypothetical protein